MNIKWIGAALIVIASGLTGFQFSASYRMEEYNLRQLIGALDYMVCELRYRQSALPDLCRQIGIEQRGKIGMLFANLADELSAQISPDVPGCLAAAASKSGQLSARIQKAVCIMGASLGRFDLDGQLMGLDAVREYCREQLETMGKDRDTRLRSYQTLGLCAGAALAILFV